MKSLFYLVKIDFRAKTHKSFRFMVLLVTNTVPTESVVTLFAQSDEQRSIFTLKNPPTPQSFFSGEFVGLSSLT